MRELFRHLRYSLADVKNFGQKMVTDHGKANEELKGLAKSKGVELGSALDKLLSPEGADDKTNM